ncbi:MAG: hypothetical protein AB8I08_40435 [Sandaracinaceae bacterium]
MARLRFLVPLLCIGCVPTAAPTQRPPTATLEQGEVLRLVAALSTPVLRAPDTPLEVLEARFEHAAGPERIALAGDVVRGRVAALEGLVDRRAVLEADAADAAAEAAQEAARVSEAQREPQPAVAEEPVRAEPDVDEPADTWDEDPEEEDDDWGEDDRWEDEEDAWEDDDGWEDDGWSSKKRRRDRRARRRDRRARRDEARRRARRGRRASRPAPVHEAPPAPPEPQPGVAGPAGALAALDRQIARGRASLERLAGELPADAPARAQAEFAVVWVAWRTEADDAARCAERFVEAHPGATDLVALAWMLRAELTYEAEASLSALRFGANRLGEPVYAYSLWRAATIQRESGDAAAARESLLAVERAACESNAPRIVRDLGYAAAEALEHGVRRDEDGILRPDTCPTDDRPEGWHPEE